MDENHVVISLLDNRKYKQRINVGYLMLLADNLVNDNSNRETPGLNKNTGRRSGLRAIGHILYPDKEKGLG